MNLLLNKTSVILLPYRDDNKNKKKVVTKNLPSLLTIKMLNSLCTFESKCRLHMYIMA